MNDAPEMDQPGDVLIFRNFDDARSYLEHWADELELPVFSASGEKLVIVADMHGYVTVDRREPHDRGEELITACLRHNAQAVFAARLHRSGKRWRRVYLGEAVRAGVLPESIEGLIAYIGFKI
ncbi:hypothetical protein G4G27_13725 [Sphingomonas sp. So64.6b]|uniref:hypothetical protein n=1 Tax=Sphingomonas sp. So64.6b TaxID=2997354 RepID=UPI0015FFF7B2|nr:hypothetical protein [Sphingomonas sp. So64.6b]QNA84936.1 hypothetical protein G4G27_13725 [Sphingomonas sp. So64.6b]